MGECAITAVIAYALGLATPFALGAVLAMTMRWWWTDPRADVEANEESGDD